MAREPTKPTDASACAPVPAIDVAIIGPQKAPPSSEPTRALTALLPGSRIPIGIPSRIRNTEQKALKAQTTKPKPRPEPHAQSAQLSSTAFSLSASGSVINCPPNQKARVISCKST